MPTFQLHPRLAADCHLLGHFPLCALLLMDDATYPWFILVPRRPGITEIHQLDGGDRALLMEESCRLGEAVLEEFGGDKLNVAALGNVVPQLHLHHIVRRVGDPAWPGPVWGHRPPHPYEGDAVARLKEGLLPRLPGLEPAP